jgi:hypothetical protein
MTARLVAWIAALALLAGWAAAAAAHEVRPALVQIVETGRGGYDVTWKRPVVGDMALRLAPHLSGGALERPPSAEQAAPGYVSRFWRVRGGPDLDGQTLSIEGLRESVTDVLVRITTRDGRAYDYVIRPAAPSLKLNLAPARGIAVPGYLRLGVAHILTGFDHLLFVFGLLLLVGPNWRLVKAVTAFTAAHSLTLGVAALGYVRFASAAIEALVALSILFVAAELVRPPDAPPTLARRHPWIIAFAFGLLHGLAFAGALSDIGLPPDAAPQALLLFNLGVEAGQLLFIAAALAVLWALARTPLRAAWSGRAWTGAAPAYLIGGLSAYWLIERTLAALQVSP